MSIPDAINGTYELFGGFFLLHSCFRLLKDKEVKGISIPAAAFFTSWGYWNLYYYPSLSQWFSFTGGLLIVAANTWWVCMALHYTRKKKLAKSSKPCYSSDEHKEKETE